MTLSVLLMALAGLVLVALAVRFARARWKHDPVEYYMGWGGTRHPITLQDGITKEEAEALAAKGAAYLIGYYADDGRLTRAVKLDRREFVFEYRYNYYPNGRLNRVRVTRGGCVTVLDYDRHGRKLSDASIAFLMSTSWCAGIESAGTRSTTSDISRHTFRCHHPRKRMIQYSRDAGDGPERPPRTGYPMDSRSKCNG